MCDSLSLSLYIYMYIYISCAYTYAQRQTFPGLVDYILYLGVTHSTFSIRCLAVVVVSILLSCTHPSG